jgi:hypothetical protein
MAPLLGWAPHGQRLQAKAPGRALEDHDLSWLPTPLSDRCSMPIAQVMPDPICNAQSRRERIGCDVYGNVASRGERGSEEEN